MSETSGQSFIEIDVNVGKALKPYQQKITKIKRKQFLEKYSKTGNFTQSANSIGVSRQSVYELIERDTDFSNAFKQVEDALLDAVESIRLSLALQPSRDGHQDAKMLLKAKRREIYGDKLQVQSNQTLTINISMPELNRILQSNNAQKIQLPEPVPDADVIEILPD